MPRFGRKSRKQLDTCDDRLQGIMNIVIEVYDFSVFCGHRKEKEQHRVYMEGYSKVDWPNSQHNLNPSAAVDIVPWHKKKPYIRWDDIDSFTELSRIIKAVAISLDIKIKWGGDFSNWKDYPHWYLKD